MRIYITAYIYPYTNMVMSLSAHQILNWATKPI